MAYIVTKNIIDTKDNNRFYEVGDLYPRPDFTVSGTRIAELVGKGVIIAEGKRKHKHQHRPKKWHRLKKLKKNHLKN